MHYKYVLNVLTKDRPGIVAALSSSLDGIGGMLLSCSQTVLNGYFTLISIIAVPNDYSPEELLVQIREAGLAGDHFLLSTAKMEEPAQKYVQVQETDSFVITAFGPENTEIIRRLSQYLADHDINIIDLFGDQSGTEFVLIGQMEVPRCFDPPVLQDDLEEIGREIGFTIRMQHRNIFSATNKIGGDWRGHAGQRR